MKYTIGLDIGIGSCGWAVINNDKNRIEDLGVRVFSIAENPKDKSSLNLVRRTARGARRRLHRKSIRMQKIKELLINYNLISKEKISNIFEYKNGDKDVWQLRVDALNRKLTNEELAKVLINIAKRRGYKSNKKSEEENNDDNGKILKNISSNKARMQEKGYRTYAEMIVNDESFLTIRNKYGEYTHCIMRADIENEIKVIFDSQRKFNNVSASEELQNKYIEICMFQLKFTNATLINKMLGNCTIFTDEKRAPKDSYTFQKFRLLQQINNLSWIENKEKIIPNAEQRNLIYNFAFENKDVTYAKIRKLLNLSNNSKFTNVSYSSFIKGSLGEDQITKEAETKTKFCVLDGYHQLRLKFKDRKELWEKIKNNEDLINNIAYIMLCNKTDEDAINAFKLADIDLEIANIAKNVNYSKVGNLSIKAMKLINPYLEDGFTYDKACEKAGIDFKCNNITKNNLLPPIKLDEIRNAVVLRSITQTRKVVNAIIQKYGKPSRINIELARDVGRSIQERTIIEKQQNINKLENEKIDKELQETFKIHSPKPFDRLKYKLWKEQNNKCGYSLKYISPEELFADYIVQVDHIIPFSRCADDGFNNKILVFAEQNQKKGNKTPFEYLGNTEYWNTYSKWVEETYKYNYRKKQQILREKFDINDEDDRKARQLNDTRYISRFILNYIENNLDFDTTENKRNVYCINGATTSMLRNNWGLSKIREEGDKHHAMDAVVISVCTQENIQKVCKLSKLKSEYPNWSNIEKKKNIELAKPWTNFTEELEFRLSDHPNYWIEKARLTNYDDIDLNNIKPIFVSRMVNQKITGKAHDETIYSAKFLNQGSDFITVRKEIKSISKQEITDIVKNKKFEKLYLSDKYTYDYIYNRMKEYNFDNKKAFPNGENIYKLNKNGKQGAQIKSITVPTVINSGVEINDKKGFAANSKIVRTDVFEKNNKYYLIPIYVADMVKDKLPNKAITAGKSIDDWTIIDDTYNFKFSLYPKSLIKVSTNPKNIKYNIEKNTNKKSLVNTSDEKYINTYSNEYDDGIFGYFTGVHSSTSGIHIMLPDNSGIIENIGSKTLKIFEKYQVDILGNISKVTKEKRLGSKKRK